MNIPQSLKRWLLLYIFVISGFTGLIYESIWSHYMKLFLGHAAYAQTLVLAIFMGGLALGSWLVARFSGRIRALLMGYVIVEATIGVLGLVFHKLFIGATDWSFDTVIPALSSNAAVHAFKWTLAGLLILPQSALLGTTFPLISGGIIRRWPERAGETLSLLYFTNSLGAAIGVLVSGFVLIAMVGLPGTMLTAALLNIALAGCVWVLVRKQEEPAPQVVAPAPDAASRAPRWFIWAAFLTGAASFFYEIGWIRMLSLVLGSSTHSFELMLSAFILGLAFGGLWMRKRIDTVKDPARYLGILMMIMGALALLTLPAYGLTFDFMAWAMHTFSPTPAGYIGFNLTSQTIAIAIMVPTTFCAGMTLPLLTHALLKRTGSERAIGTVYAANTAGAIAGVLLAVHVVMPTMGVKGVIMTGAAIHMALGLSGLLLIATLARSMQLRAALACGVALVAVGVFVKLDPMRMTSAVFRTGSATQPQDTKVVYLRDGRTATVSLTQFGSKVVIATNGKPDAGIEMGTGPVASDEVTMVLAAALPLMLHPNPARVANIGFGSGLTSHALLSGDRVKHLDSIEIEPFMVEAAKLGYYPRINRVFEDPRSHIIYDDAKTFFATVREPYDIIVSEPSNPWVSGVATLFSEEFYSRISRYLNPDGYFVQWLQIYETDISVVSSVLKALGAHFPRFAIYVANDSNILIIATRSGALPTVSDEMFQTRAMRAELARVGIQSAGDVQERRIGDERTLRPMLFSFPGPPNSDYFPFVDLNAPRLRYMQRNALELINLLTQPIPVDQILLADIDSDPVTPSAGTGVLMRDAFVRGSRTIRDALLHGKRANMHPEDARDVLLVAMQSAQCADPAAREVWRQAVRRIANSTATFLPESDLREIWRVVRESPCYKEHSGPHRDWADLLAAVAMRDSAGIVPLADALLGPDPATLPPDEHAYLVVAASAAKLRNGAADEAWKLLTQAWNRTDLPVSYELTMRHLLTVSQAAPDKALAEMPPALVERVE